MGEFEIGRYLAGFGIFTIAIIIGVVYLQGSAQSGDSMVSTSEVEHFNESFNYVNDFENEVANARSQATANPSGNWWDKVLSFLDGLIFQAWSYVKLLFTNWSFTSGVVTNIGVYFGANADILVTILGVVGAIVGIMLVYALYKLIFWGRRP